MRMLTIMVISLAAIAVSGCAVTTAGVKPGDERNFVRSLDDVNAGRAIKARMVRAAEFNLSKVDIEVAEGIAVLTGHVPSQEDRIEAERIAWSAPQVLQVGNEVQLDNKTGIIRSTKDTVLSTAVRTRLIAEKSVKSRNINIETHNGVIYLLGVARTPQELERTAYIASTTKGAKEVISYIKMAGAEVQSANFVSAAQDETVRIMPQQRTLPDGLSTQPGGMSGDYAPPSQPAPPMPGLGDDALQSGEPYYRDPKTGERIILPPGTKTVPYNPKAAADPVPHYVDPATGEKIQIRYVYGR